jgi:uncharacterized protein YdiU (UPF0061 family)
MPDQTTATGELFAFDNTYARELAGFYVPYEPVAAPRPQLLKFNTALADELGLDLGSVAGNTAGEERLARIFSAGEVPTGANPLAQAYAGHQYGGFVPQLGDGRAMLLGEVIDRHGRRRDIAFKGSGPTMFSRGGDGKAAVGPVLREYLLGEAMHALGIPTTRALAAVATGEPVRRERALPGAVLTRVAASHVRVGTFQFFAVRGDLEKLRKLADYVIARHEPQAVEAANPYLALLEGVVAKQASLIAQWMLVGFVHGVMNTDNMALSGETIDYGPCAFMEAYDPATVFSSIDHGGRYAYGNQPRIAVWNLARFAETLLPLIDNKLTDSTATEPVTTDPHADGLPASDAAVSLATEALNRFEGLFQTAWLAGLRAKLGLATTADDGAGDLTLANDWLDLIKADRVDFTLAWRRLADATEGRPEALERLFHEHADSRAKLHEWLVRRAARLAHEGRDPSEVAAAMRRVSPIYIPRNERVEEALKAASDTGDLGPFERLLEAVTNPFEERPGFERYAEPAAVEFTRCYRTFCGT